MFTYSRSTIKANPQLDMYRLMLPLVGIVAAVTLFMTILMLIIIVAGGPATHILPAFIIELPMFALMLINFSWQYRGWKRLEKRRLAAARGDYTLLAEEQPVPNTTALPLPAFFKMNLSKAQILFISVLIVLVVILFSVSGWLIIGGVLLWVFLLGGAVIAALLLLLIFGTSRQVLEVTEVGLRMRASRLSGWSGMVRWNEAHLFALYSIPGALKSGAVLTYELASASSIVRWTRIVRPGPFGLHLDPGMPLAEHIQAMQALCQLISAQTGLSLYDLRKEQPPASTSGDHAFPRE